MKASEKLYRKSPYFLKVLFLNAIGFLNKRLRYSDNFKRYFEEYKVLWNANSETLDTFQSEQLKKLLLESHSSSEWYQKIMRENGISQKMIENDPFEALAKMPILTKSDRKENPTKIAVKHRETNAKGYTSGTSGSPTVNFMDKESIERSFALWKRFHWTLGIQKNDRHIRLSGRLIIKPERNSPPFWIYNHPEHQLLMSTYHLKQEFLRHYVKKIDTFKPVYLDGYPSAVFVLAKYINENSIVIKNTPKAIAVTAETLYDYQKAEIEKAFKCKVFNQYASSEGSPFITACKEGNLHVNIDSGVFEFLDRNNTPSKPGEVGRMIVTSFRNLKTPLIRYDIGDTVLLNKSDTPCSCGCSMPMVANIIGREDDILWTPDKGYVGRMDTAYKGLKGIVKSQIIQEKPNFFTLNMEIDGDYNELIQNQFISNLKDRLGQNISCKVNIVEEIPLGANGKFIAVKRNFKLDDALLALRSQKTDS